jgi:hypothetical protein
MTPEKAELMVRLLSQTTPLSAGELVQLGNIVGIAIGAHEVLFGLRTRGLIEEPIYHRLATNSRGYVRTPGGRRVWSQLRKLGSDPRFVAEIDAMLADDEVSPAAHATRETPAS